MELTSPVADWTVVAFVAARLVALAALTVAVWQAVRRRRS
jgi:uncharacterized membrane protein YhfC